MANNKEQQKISNKPLSDEEIKTKPSPQKQKNASYSKNTLKNGLAIFIACIALVMVLYEMQLNHALQKKLLAKNNGLAREITQLQTQQTTNQEQFNSKTEDLQQAQTLLQQQLEQFNNKLQKTRQEKPYQNQDWLLLKARYYLELAQINSHWTTHSEVVIALLQEADKLLAPLQDSKIFAIRQAIAKEIIQLKAVPTLDIPGLLSQLDSIQISVSSLATQSLTNPNESASTNALELPSTTLQGGLHLLKQLVIIRRDDEPIKPLMSPLLESIFKESIRLNLQQAQWAILNKEPVLYQWALKQAIITIKKAFGESSKNASLLLGPLLDLQAIKITPELPSAELALPLLNQLIESKKSLTQPEQSKGEN